MKICYICDEINLKSGWAVTNYYTVLQAVKNGYQVTVLTSRKGDNLSIPGAEIFPILNPIKDSGWMASLYNNYKTLTFLMSCDADAFHILIEPLLILNLFLRRKKVFLSIHGTYSVSVFTKSRFKLLYRRALRHVHHVFSNSLYTKNQFVSTTGFSSVTVTGLGVDFARFHQPSNITNKKMSFCLIGHFKERKGCGVALQALEILLPQYPNLNLVFAGNDDSQYAKVCKQIAKSKGLEKNILFKGRVSDQDLERVYQECLGNILPSMSTKEGAFEGFGLIHLEANATGLPTIGSLQSGNEEAIHPGVNGYLARQNDPLDLAEQMKKIITSYLDGSYPQFSESCVNFARKMSWEKYFQELDKVYHL